MTPGDIPIVADLQRRLFPGSERSSLENLQSYLMEIFFNHPWLNPEFPSLVYQEEDGRMIGCLGVMPRRMSFGGEPIRVAVSHNFMVEPGNRSGLAAVQLLKRFFSGPQDLSMAEGNDVSRRIWEGLGGMISPLYSIRWTRPIQPSRYFLSFMRDRGLPGPIRALLAPFCAVADAIGTGAPRSPFHQSAPGTSTERLERETFLSTISEFTRDRALRPEYDDRSLEWLFGILAQRRGRGTVQKMVVRDAKKSLIGWYICYMNPGGTSEVVQIAAKKSTVKEVLDALFHHAWREGAFSVSGQLDPAMMQAYSEKYCLFHRGASSVLIYSKRPELIQAIDRGNAFLTRLEGEWWIGLQGGWV